MIPCAKLVNYLKQWETANANDMLETLRWVDHIDKDAQGLFPPSILWLIFPAFYGVNVLYDTHDCMLLLSLGSFYFVNDLANCAPETIMEWCDLNQKEWQDCPC
jgi:hypothetical protein